MITGFRVGRGGAQEREGIVPDLTTLGKIIGGGLPVGAFGGRADIMAYLSPDGPVYQAGTLSGNPLAMAAGAATLGIVAADDPHLRATREDDPPINRRACRRRRKRHGMPHTIAAAPDRCSGCSSPDGPVDRSRATRETSESEALREVLPAMLDHGVYLAPSQFEAGFLSTAHSERDVERTLAVADDALPTVFGDGVQRGS